MYMYMYVCLHENLHNVLLAIDTEGGNHILFVYIHRKISNTYQRVNIHEPNTLFLCVTHLQCSDANAQLCICAHTSYTHKIHRKANVITNTDGTRLTPMFTITG